jgi:glycosyltransferase involved in cell wall biosynthesis
MNTPKLPAGPRRILHVPRRFVEHEWGGTESVLANLLAAQRGLGWEPEIHTSLALSTVRRESWRGIEVRRYPYVYPFFGLNAAQKAAMDKKGGNLMSCSLLWALWRRPDVRLLHAHVLKRPGGIVRTAARRRGLPYVVTLHGGIFDVPKAELASLTEAQEGKFEWGKFAGALLGSRRVLDDAGAVICVGRVEAEKARKALPHDRVHHIGNGVDCAFFSQGDGAGFRAKHGLPASARVMLCVSRFDPQKDQLAVVEAFDAQAARHPDLHLVLAGPATLADYVAKIDARIAASPHASRVRRLASLAPGSEELAGAFQAAEVFMIASRHEPFGIVALEAWSAGVCVVASTAGGLADLVRDGETGFSFAPGDAAGAAAALGRALDEREPARRCAAAGRARATGEFAWSRIAEQTEAAYQAAEAWWAASRGR